MLFVFVLIELDCDEAALAPVESMTLRVIIWPEAMLQSQVTVRSEVWGRFSMIDEMSPALVTRMLKGGVPPVIKIW